MHPHRGAPSEDELSIRHLLLLKSLRRDGSIVAAADSMNMSVAVASRLLNDVQDQFGLPMFERAGRNLRATAAGEALIDWAGLVLADFGSMQNAIDAIAAGAERVIRIGVTQFMPPRLVPDVVSTLLRDFPLARIVLRSGTDEQLAKSLLDGDLDGAIVGDAHPTWQDERLELQPLTLDAIAIVARFGRFAGGNGAFDPTTLTEDRWVLPVSTAAARRRLLDRLAALGMRVPGAAAQTSSLILLLELVERHDYVSLLPLSCASHYAEHGGLAVHVLSADQPYLAVSLVTDARRPSEGPVRSLRSHFKRAEVLAPR